ncbi:MAG: DUF3078 domain-containing protein [Bacteroidales bacterium]
MRKSILLIVAIWLGAFSNQLFAQYETIEIDSTLVANGEEIDTIDLEIIPVIKQKGYGNSLSSDTVVPVQEYEVIDLDSIRKEEVKKSTLPPPLMVERLQLISDDYKRELNIDFNEIMRYIRNRKFIPHSKEQDARPALRDEIALNEYLTDRGITVADTTVALLQLLQQWYDYDNYWDPQWGFDDKLPISKIFLPIVFKGNELLPNPNILYQKGSMFKTEELDLRLDTDVSFLTKKRFQDSLENMAIKNVLQTMPLSIRYSYKSLPKEIIKERHIEASAIPKLFEPENLISTDYGRMTPIEIKPKNWIPNFQSTIHFSQSYLSENWFQGGESSILLNSVQLATLNYTNYNNITWNTLLEWRLGFISSPSDSLRSFKASDDQLRFYSIFNLKAYRKWNYSLSAEFKTKIFDSYTPNTKNLTGGFLSPANANLNLGMNYVYANEKKTFSISALLAPGALSLIYVANKDLPSPNPKNPDSRTYITLGSSITGSMVWKMTPFVTWTSRVYLFTNYERTLVEFENTLDMILNRYLSTRIYVYPRFDDALKLKNPGDSYLQFKEIISFGFNFKI